jgi:hypothetical protein
MKRMFGLGLLALPALLAADTAAFAQSCGHPGSNCGTFRAGFAGFVTPHAHMGCGGFCFRFLGGIHQHGPLFNYGPYAGYYPFAPYGPWDANLNWAGPYPPQGSCGWFGLCGKGGCGRDGCPHCGGSGHFGNGRNGLLGHKGGCDGCDSRGYSVKTWDNVNRRVQPLSHWGKGKKSCEGCTASVELKPVDGVVQTGLRTER